MKNSIKGLSLRLNSENKSEYGLLRCLCILLITFIMAIFYESFFMNTIVKAEENRNVSFKDEILSKNYYTNRDINLKGVFSSDRSYFSVDEHWSVKSAQFSFSLTQSELLYKDLSTITLFVNDKASHSMRLTDIKEDGGVITLSLPVEYIKQGINELRIEVYRRISDNQCADDINKGNWVTIKNGSFIHLEFNEQKPTDSISEYPYPFLRAGENSAAAKTIIILPDNPDEEELAAAFEASANLGSFLKDGDTKINMEAYSKVGEEIKKASNIIYIGKLNKVPKEISNGFSKDALSDAKEGALILRNDSPYNKENKLMCLITDRNDGMLDKAVKFLFNQDLVKQVSGNIGFLGKDMDVSIKPKKEVESNISIKDLGYGDGIYMKGPLHQETTIGIKLPKNRQLVTGSKVKLNMRYSKNLDFTKALVTAYINGIPIGSKKLEAFAADNDSLELNIPGDAIKSSYVELKIAFDLEVVDMKCSLKAEEMPWAFVISTSSIYLPTKAENSFLFENYPWPFVKDGRLNNVTVIVPDNADSVDLNLLSNILAYIGKSIYDNTGNLTVVRDSNFNEKVGDSNIILLGAPGDLNALRKVNNNMFFKYDSSYSYFLSNEIRSLIEDFSRTLASIQLTASPYNKSSGMLIVTAPEKKNLPNLLKYLTQSKYVDSLIGNAALVNTWGEITNHYFLPKNEKASSLLNKIQAGGQNLQVFIILFITLVLLLIIAIVMYYRKYKRK